VHYEPDWRAVPPLLADLALRSGQPTLLVTMGAGDVTDIGPQVLGLLGQSVDGRSADDGTV
jgi:UDP-N-acetylmuramate--alanine ligase